LSELFVLDCSVAARWCFEDESEAYADWVLDRLNTSKAVVPSLWFFEIANVLAVGERRNRITRTSATRRINLLRSLPIAVDEGEGFGLLERIVALAWDHHLTSYDATYLELALRRGLALATLDRELRNAVKASGAKLLERAANGPRP
jgi:predicted nucleic acid-binding protein